MRLIRIIIFLNIFLFSAVSIFAQNVITFDDQNWSSDTTLPSNFMIHSFTFSSNESFYTNYGYNFNVNGISLYYVFQNTNLDKITITSPDNNPVNLVSLAAYQVSETSKDSLVIEGWDNSSLKYSHSFPNDSNWTIYTLNYDNINKIIIRLDSVGKGGLTDYNFDNFTFTSSISSVSNDSALVPLRYNLSQNYPNPFNPNTVISYRIAKPGRVVLKIYDLLGREVSTLVDEYKPADNYTVYFNASKLSSGVYIYILSSNGFVSSHKMVLLK